VTRGAPGAVLRRVLKKLSGALFPGLLDSMIFIRPGATLRREAGAGAHGTRASPRAALSREVGTGAAVTRGAPGAILCGPGAALSREVETRAAVTRGAPGAALRREAGAAPEACPEPVYCWLFLVISS
jgi:hypothetical protein